MKKEEKKPFIQCCILGAIGGILMAAGDWLLGCVPLQKTDTGMFNRACYLSGAYALWKPAGRRNGSAWVLPLLLHGEGTEYGY